jgi:hypothetical protein
MIQRQPPPRANYLLHCEACYKTSQGAPFLLNRSNRLHHPLTATLTHTERTTLAPGLDFKLHILALTSQLNLL